MSIRDYSGIANTHNETNDDIIDTKDYSNVLYFPNNKFRKI